MNADSSFSPIILTGLNVLWEKSLALGAPMHFKAGRKFSDARSPEESLEAGVYYIREGLVRLSSIGADGVVRTMLFMGRDVFFNEVPMLQRGEGYMFTCMEETETIFLPKRLVVGKILKENDALRKNLLDAMSRKSRCYHVRIKDREKRSALGRVCNALYSMHLYQRDGKQVQPRLTQKDLADYLGLHIRTVQKILARLKADGITGRYSHKSLEIHAPDKLRSFANQENSTIG